MILDIFEDPKTHKYYQVLGSTSMKRGVYEEIKLNNLTDGYHEQYEKEAVRVKYFKTEFKEIPDNIKERVLCADEVGKIKGTIEFLKKPEFKNKLDKSYWKKLKKS